MQPIALPNDVQVWSYAVPRSRQRVAPNYENDVNIRGGLSLLVSGVDVPDCLKTLEAPLLEDRLSEAELAALIRVMLALIAMEMDEPEEESIPWDYASA